MDLPEQGKLMLDWDAVVAYRSGQSDTAHHIFGAHATDHGFRFVVWAPNAAEVCVIGDFNDWTLRVNSLHLQGELGIWTGVVDGAKHGQRYKFAIRHREAVDFVLKADPYANCFERPPDTASRLYQSAFVWKDRAWLAERAARHDESAPISIYEVHLGSWMRQSEGYPNYRDIAQKLAFHVHKCGFTHVEFLPLTHHPFYGSWGYQCLGYFAPTAFFGEPDDLRFLIDFLHRRGIGVILDWVPAHFPMDAHGLYRFDGQHLYEYEDPQKGFHPDWNTAIFDYQRPEVRSFLMSSARYWLEEFHVDGLRVDAVASMLYLDYSRSPGEWKPNAKGGRENLEAVGFLQDLNTRLRNQFPDAIVIAEESTIWPQVSAPVEAGGLGFHYKWDMGWMHDFLLYMRRETQHRRFHHSELSIRASYVFSERFVLALSHDEVVHEKRSLIDKMPGDAWQKRANLRALLAVQIAQPGKKMLFMGMEFGQWREWNHEAELDWELLQQEEHASLLACLAELQRFYRSKTALHQLDLQPSGVCWSNMQDGDRSIMCFLRFDKQQNAVLIVCNFTPHVYYDYIVGVPNPGSWVEFFNSDDIKWGGSGVVATQPALSANLSCHQQPYSIQIGVPPLGVSFWELKK